MFCTFPLILNDRVQLLQKLSAHSAQWESLGNYTRNAVATVIQSLRAKCALESREAVEWKMLKLFEYAPSKSKFKPNN